MINRQFLKFGEIANFRNFVKKKKFNLEFLQKLCIFEFYNNCRFSRFCQFSEFCSNCQCMKFCKNFKFLNFEFWILILEHLEIEFNVWKNCFFLKPDFWNYFEIADKILYYTNKNLSVTSWRPHVFCFDKLAQKLWTFSRKFKILKSMGGLKIGEFSVVKQPSNTPDQQWLQVGES